MKKKPNITEILPEGDLSRGVGKRLTQEQRDQKRIERMTLAAFELFTEKGYQNTTIEMLCSRANVSTRDFYKLIKTREALMHRVYRRVFGHVESCVLLALAEAPKDDYDVRLSIGVDAWVHAYTRDPRYARLAYIEGVGVSNEIENLRRASHEKFASLIRSEFELRSADTGSALRGKLPLAIIGACNELVTDWLGKDKRPPPQELSNEIQELYQIVFRGLKADR